ncbi:hypothetical protein QBC39DRAFT_284169, partial [Podospora conica]
MMLKNTEGRDKDQVVYRWAKKHKATNPSEDPSTPILMVDQLWLWVLPDGTVITSLPDTRKSWERYNIRKTLSYEIEANKRRQQIQGPNHLVSVVLKICLDIVTREGPGGVNLLECFQSVINKIAEDHALAMKSFLEKVTALSKATDPFRFTAEIDSFSYVFEETRLLVKIGDVQDELHTIKSVLITQKTVLDELKDVVKNTGAFNQAERIVNDGIARVDSLINSTMRMPEEVKQLLDYKKQQASRWEVRYGKKLSEQGKRQNQIMLIFTIMTIIFLPLSFISSFLAIGVREFPKGEGSSETDWPLSTASSYLFGISIGVSALILICVALWFAIMRKKWRKRQNRQLLFESKASRVRESSSDESDLEKESPARGKRQNAKDDPDGPGIRSMASAGRRRARNEDDSSSSGSEDTGDDDGEYARLFSRWNWHTHMPIVRWLWEWKLYKVRRGARPRMRRSREPYEWDYPLNRWRRGLKSAFQPTRKWKLRRVRGKKEKTQMNWDCDGGHERAEDDELGVGHDRRAEKRKERVEGGVKSALGKVMG